MATEEPEPTHSLVNSSGEVVEFEPRPIELALPHVPSALGLSLCKALRLSCRGPTTHSNWLIPGRLLASAYPGFSGIEPMHSTQLTAFLEAGAR
jgi:hypothetical protein